MRATSWIQCLTWGGSSSWQAIVMSVQCQNLQCLKLHPVKCDQCHWIWSSKVPYWLHQVVPWKWVPVNRRHTPTLIFCLAVVSALILAVTSIQEITLNQVGTLRMAWGIYLTWNIDIGTSDGVCYWTWKAAMKNSRLCSCITAIQHCIVNHITITAVKVWT